MAGNSMEHCIILCHHCMLLIRFSLFMSLISFVEVLYEFAALQNIYQLHAPAYAEQGKFIQLGIAVYLFFKTVPAESDTTVDYDNNRALPL